MVSNSNPKESNILTQAHMQAKQHFLKIKQRLSTSEY